MTSLAILILIFLVLFSGAFVSRRRFGLLGLSLTAGATISVIWADTAGLMIGGLGVMPDGPVTRAVVLSVIVLLPAILLLFHGYSYKNMVSRVVGSFLFACLGLVFLIEPIGHILPLEGVGVEVFNQIISYKNVVISVGVVLAVVDIFFTKPGIVHEKHSRKHH